jgi:putative FmdB family regulatory protein
MPIYEYRCEDCGTKFEKLVRSSETNGLACPSCGTEHLKMELSTFAAHSGTGARGASEPMTGGCPGGMCRMPDVCGRN